MSILARLTAAAAVLTASDEQLKLTTTLQPTISQPSVPDLIEVKVNGLDQAKANAIWLTKGQDRSQPTTAVRLVDCTSDHLKSIVANKPNLSPDYLRVIESILEDRGEALDSITVIDHDDVTDDPTDRFSHLT